NHARLEWYPRIGFQFQDYHDKKMIALFADIFCELEERITLYKSNGDIQDYFYTPRYILDGKLTSLGKEISLNV
ncbi:chromosome partitioning protein ParA, partial [Enterococcus faecalis]